MPLLGLASAPGEWDVRAAARRAFCPEVPSGGTDLSIPPRRRGVLGQAASVQELPFRGSRAVARGRTTKGRLRGPRFVRLFPDVYMPAGVPIDHLVLSLAAAEWVSTAGGTVSGYSAATLLGADCAPRDAPAEVLVRGHVRSQPRLRVTRGSATGADRWTVRRLRLLLVLAGLPAPEVQFPLVADRYLVARFDLAHPAAKLAVEYDGAGHVDDLDRRRVEEPVRPTGAGYAGGRSCRNAASRASIAWSGRVCTGSSPRTSTVARSWSR